MKDQHFYREQLLAAIEVIETGKDDLAAIALHLVLFEDMKNDCVPFEDGDEIPVDMALIDNSDIPSVKLIRDVILKLQEIHSYLLNINSFPQTDDSAYEELSPEELDSFEPLYPVGNRDTLDDLKRETGDFISHIMSSVLHICYCLIYGHEPPEKFPHYFYFPEEETYSLLESDDINTNTLIILARFLQEKREEAWDLS